MHSKFRIQYGIPPQTAAAVGTEPSKLGIAEGGLYAPSPAVALNLAQLVALLNHSWNENTMRIPTRQHMNQELRVDESSRFVGVPTHRLVVTSLDY